ncbi:hypothetical protein PENANT_c012G03964 [Penicillium antarcticum]|uniref:Shugoshin C-terminal domain-containing protein n=1 Tax=Penicillium antarcticum TaxID=416450 RepID=A0A1V6Q699_9EURO|nr:hypothetical protein PENANT_c012G03964 [Penicillium antarcticum]
MARLNDYAAPAESIDVLKRRFVRQNREIARMNSLQSLRIRSLESEVSHLLSENVLLRKQVINLTQETERLEAAKSLHDGIYDIKSKLDAKLAELSSLATDLGSLPRKMDKMCDEQSDRPKMAESRLRNEDSMGYDDGRLPAIVEDQYYPRRTLEPQELENMVRENQSIFDSPQEPSLIEDHDEPDIQNPSPSPPETNYKSQIESDSPGDTEPEPVLPPTLETRKKKKKSTSIAPLEPVTAEIEQPTSPRNDSGHPKTSGSKRKFCPEDDDQLSSTIDMEDDEFQFSRPTHSPKKQMNPFGLTRRDQSPVKTNIEMTRESTSLGPPKRKVLEPKSSNSNLGSPKKARASSGQDSKVLQRPTKGDENTSSPQKTKDAEKLSEKTLNQRPRVSQIVSSKKEKRTSRPSEYEEAAPSLSALSPHPNAVKVEAESDVSSGIRPSRRRGAVVSYAEPNLRDKMRRPTKEMIDAVALGSRRSSSFQAGRDSLNGEDIQPSGSFSANLVSAEQNPDVFSQDGSSEQLMAMVSRRKRKVSSVPKDDVEPGHPNSGLQKEIENSIADISAQVSQDTSSSKRQTRRHSSNPKMAPLLDNPEILQKTSTYSEQDRLVQQGVVSELRQEEKA